MRKPLDLPTKLWTVAGAGGSKGYLDWDEKNKAAGKLTVKKLFLSWSFDVKDEIEKGNVLLTKTSSLTERTQDEADNAEPGYRTRSEAMSETDEPVESQELLGH